MEHGHVVVDPIVKGCRAAAPCVVALDALVLAPAALLMVVRGCLVQMAGMPPFLPRVVSLLLAQPCPRPTFAAAVGGSVGIRAARHTVPRPTMDWWGALQVRPTLPRGIVLQMLEQ